MSSTTDIPHPDGSAPLASAGGALPHPLHVRPCAVCIAYVPAATGCKHWRGDGAPVPAKSTASAARKRDRDRARQQANREAEKLAKDRAKASVDAFGQLMTRGET